MNKIKSIRLPLVMLLVLSSSACSVKDRTQSYGVSVEVPRTLSSSSTMNVINHNSSSMMSSFTTPTTMGNFQCYGLNVMGPGIQADSRYGCTDPNSGMGLIAGLIPTGSSTLDIMVPAGPSRRVQLFGIQSNIGCPLLNDLLNAGGKAALDSLGDPYLLGESTVDIFDDASVSINAKYVAGVTPKAFQHCGNSGSGNGSAQTLQFDLVNDAPFVMSGSCSRIRINTINSNGVFPSVQPVVTSGTATFYPDPSSCSGNTNAITGYIPSNFNGNQLDVYVKATSNFTAQLQTTATGFTIQAPVNFTTVADKVFVSTPPTSAQVGACTQIMMSVSTGSLGAMLIKFRNNWGGSLSVPSLQIYSDNTCTTPLTMTTVGSDKTYTLNATDFPTITSTFTSIFIKDSLPEHVQIGISRVAIPLEPLGFEMNFNPFYASTPSVLSGNYNISNTFNMSFSSMTPGFSITSVDIGGVPCAITVATVSTLTCTIPSNINPLVQLGNKPIYFNMVDGSSNHYNVYSGYDWTFARPPLIIANQQINVMTNSTPNTNIFVDVGPGAPNAGTISCSGALPGSSYFNAGCNLTGYNTATVGTYSVAVTASDNYGSASPVTVIINVISTQAVAPTVTAQSMALGIGVVVANSIVLGGGTPTSCYFSGCTLPPGLGLTNSCQLVGMIPLGTPHGSQACMVNVSNNIGSNAGSIGINW